MATTLIVTPPADDRKLLAPVWHTVVLILFVGGIQLLCLSVIGSYLAHIYEEVKRRPPYIVADIRNRPSSPNGSHQLTEQAGVRESESSAVL